MVPHLADSFGNPSGGHAGARAAKTALEEAREEVAEALGASASEVVMTAGGTESDNLGVLGPARVARTAGWGDGVVTTMFEHKGVLAPCDRLEREGFRVRRATVTRGGVVNLGALAEELDERTVLVSVMLVNNEVGTIQPLGDLVALVREHAPRAVVHTDAVQGVPWLDVATATADVDLVSISAHKFGGPKGTGALIVRGDVPIEPLIEGGGQERGLRAGTVNVAGAVAMAAALRTTRERRDVERAHAGRLRDRLAAGIAASVADCFFNGDASVKIEGNCHVGFPGVEAETLLVALDQRGVLAAAGSSCSSGATEPSHVLAAMGVPHDHALGSIRLSLGFASTDADIDHALAVIPDAVEQLRFAGRRESGASELAGAASERARPA